MNAKKIALYGGLGAVAVLLLLHHRATSGAVAGGPSDPYAQFQAPYLTNTPGVNGSLLNGGGAPFTSIINVGITADSARYLNSDYMPLFGFAGMGVSGSLPNAINVTVNPAQVPAPPAPAAFSAPPAAPAPQETWNVRMGGNSAPLQNGYYDMTGPTPRGLTRNLTSAGRQLSGF